MSSNNAPSGSSIQGHTRTLANAIRVLSMDGVQAANSGHPGLPLGMADVATVLFTKFLKFDAAHPEWPDRDRFVLSNGHGSMLLYSLLYLNGYPKITLDNLKAFRKLESPCAGHPEYGMLPGIETTTGPLGQGLANAVGFALGERIMNARFGNELVDHKTYVFCGDGCLMEGISHEAISLAGHLKLNKLVVLFDDNHISIDGPTSMSESTDQIKRFEAAGWATQSCDGHNADEIAAALQWAQNSDKPVLIACRTIIGFGSPKKQGTSKAHGEPLGAEEILATKKNLGWPSEEPFFVPSEILADWRQAGTRGAAAREAWELRKNAAPKKAELEALLSGDAPAALFEALNEVKKKASAEKPAVATRKASEMALEAINTTWTATIGGSADLTPSNNTRTKDLVDITPDDYAGRYIRYGVREHAMAAAMNGLALHGGVVPYGGTFLVFSDYCRHSIRLSALMGIRVIYVMTHDSIGVGEDGPTHQPVEHVASLRAIPGLKVFRPGDVVETAECWAEALADKAHASLMVLSRQNMATFRTTHTDENLSAKGGYVAAEAEGAKVTLIATGSEVEMAFKARDLLAAENITARVVSMPCWALFEQQSETYREAVLGKNTVKVAIEAGLRFGWDRYIGSDGVFIGMSGFGASGPAKEVYKHFGITAEHAVEAAKSALKA
ncbi:MAG: transketolase [Rhizomicrobium sp.]|nr:transketolase [Rhizomicrobium sp.]